VIYSANQYLC